MRKSTNQIKIFISYAREDQARVKRLYYDLEAAGFDPWLDREHILPGQRWEPIIKQALKNADFAMVCLSATSIDKRGFLQKEIKQALEQMEEKLEEDVWLIPARLDDCAVPASLSEIQWVDLFEPDGFEQLLRAIEYQLNRLGKPMPKPPAMAGGKPAAPVAEQKLPSEKAEPAAKLLPRERIIENRGPEPRPSVPSGPAAQPDAKVPIRETPEPPAKPPAQRAAPIPARNERRVAKQSSKFNRQTAVFTAGALLVTLLGVVVWRQLYSKSASPSPEKTLPTSGPVTSKVSRISLANGVDIEMVELPGGTFGMGSSDGEGDEKPIHQVRLSPFSIGKYEVTQRQWKAVMGSGNNPSQFQGDDLPVETVSWDEVNAFLKKAGNGFRLPTEAEWEYAARAGSAAQYSFGDDESKLKEYAWFDGNAGSQTHPVGQLKPNAFGLFDMHGNVSEWCSDWYGDKYYEECHRKGTVANPQGPSSGTFRVVRGGSWGSGAVYCRSAVRGSGVPGFRYVYRGFRLVRNGP